jgi:hypothetical protein
VKEIRLTGTQIGLERFEQPDESGHTYRLCIVDGMVNGDGTLAPGSGSGDVFWVYMSDAAVAELHRSSAGASDVVLPAPPKLVVPRGKRR